jgi:membrane protein implicated in regulation of membrane protease activity
MWLYPVFRWFQANPWAKWVAGIAAAFVAFRVWLWRKIKSERKDAKAEGKREVIEQIEEKTNEAVQRVEDDRARVRDLNDEQLRKLIAKDPNNRGRLPDPQAD